MQGTHTITSKKTTPKWTKDVNRRFSREDKRRPNSRISRQGNACHDQWVVSSPLGMAVINKPQDNKCQRGRGEQGPLAPVAGNVNRCHHYGKQRGVSLKDSN